MNAHVKSEGRKKKGSLKKKREKTSAMIENNCKHGNYQFNYINNDSMKMN